MIIVNSPESLEWKHPGVPGIRCKEIKNSDPLQFDVISWPSNLPELTQAKVNIWEAEHILAKPHNDAVKSLDHMKALKSIVIWVAPLLGKTLKQAREEIIEIYKGLN